MPFRSEHHRATLANAAMRLTIDPLFAGPRLDGQAQLFDAIDANGDSVVIAIEDSSWDSLFVEFGAHSLAELEQLALTGGWEGQGDERVWRVTLI
jgi:hypothetical protein